MKRFLCMPAIDASAVVCNQRSSLAHPFRTCVHTPIHVHEKFDIFLFAYNTESAHESNITQRFCFHVLNKI